MTASVDGRREYYELIRPEVLRIIAGIVANPVLMTELIEGADGAADQEFAVSIAIAHMAVDHVSAADHVLSALASDDGGDA